MTRMMCRTGGGSPIARFLFKHVLFSLEGIEYKWNRQLRRERDRLFGPLTKALVHERRVQETLSGDKSPQYRPKAGSIVAGGKRLRWSRDESGNRAIVLKFALKLHELSSEDLLLYFLYHFHRLI